MTARIERHCECRKGNLRVLRGRERRGKWVLDADQGIAEWTWRIGELHLGAEGRSINHAFGENRALPGVIEDAAAAAKAGLAIAEYVESKTNARGKILIGRTHAAFRHARIALEEQAGRSVDKLRRFLAAGIRIGAELLNPAPIGMVPWIAALKPTK